MTTTNPHPQVDPALAARLERLAAGRTGSSRASVEARSARSPGGAVAPSGARRHPARRARVGALVLSLLTLGGLSAAFALEGGGTIAASAPAGIVVTGAGSPGTGSGPGAVSATTTPADAPTAPPSASPTVVNGDAVPNRYGTVQVQATFAADGTITAVDVLEVPSGDRRSVRINDEAVPILNQEALSVQSATGVHTVSGATYTSHGYQQSLQAAIDIAHANGITVLA